MLMIEGKMRSGWIRLSNVRIQGVQTRRNKKIWS
jgi:hypothetical protein